jgi:hypothetical protein
MCVIKVILLYINEARASKGLIIVVVNHKVIDGLVQQTMRYSDTAGDSCSGTDQMASLNPAMVNI